MRLIGGVSRHQKAPRPGRPRERGRGGGRGRTVRRQDAEWGELRRCFPALPGESQIVVLDIEAGQTSCGYAVPRYLYTGERDTLARWAEKKGAVGLLDYWREKNQVSIDGLPTGLLEDA